MTGDEAHRDLSQRVPSVGASDPKDLGCATLLALEYVNLEAPSTLIIPRVCIKFHYANTIH